MEKIKYVYILSQRYSGSTLLSFLLGTHTDIATIGERRKFYVNSIADGGRELKCSCGEQFQKCAHWNQIKTNIFESYGENNILLNPTEFQLFENKFINKMAYEYLLKAKLWGLPSPMIPFSNKLKKQCEFNEKLVIEILKLNNKNTFLDSSKSIGQLLFLKQIERFDIHVIWLFRDPRAQVYSALKYNDWTVGKAAKEWKSEMELNAKVLDGLKLNYTKLAYESLCENPKDEMKRILEFAGLDSLSFSLDFRSQEQHIMGNFSMRLGSDSKIEVRNEWQENLSKDDINAIDTITNS